MVANPPAASTPREQIKMVFLAWPLAKLAVAFYYEAGPQRQVCAFRGVLEEYRLLEHTERGKGRIAVDLAPGDIMSRGLRWGLFRRGHKERT